MSTTLLGWLLIATSIAISAPVIFRLGLTGAEWREAAERLVLRSRPRSSSRGLGGAGTLIVAAAVFVVVAGVGTATSYWGDRPAAAGSESTASPALAHSGLDGETLAQLTDYALSTGTEKPASQAAPDKLLPDVNTMIERLAARLETAPGDVEGWRMLGWSYFHTGRYGEAAAAYGKAAELDPNSAELKAAYEEAKAKASESDTLDIAASLQAGAAGTGGDGPGAEGTNPASEATPPQARDAQIRSMVDGLAARLESSPRDVEGWTRLMRSRVVLGEREVAETAFRKALDVFKDDAAASGRITAAATELGLKAE